jgi:exopolyphosphatase/guanosine-5'-triphosphate,3'-diphosphate pyrophosphatase
MGCVSFTRRFFPEGRITREAHLAAKVAAGVELASIVERYRSLGWKRVVGSSGTILAVREVLRSLDPKGAAIRPEGLERLEQALFDAGDVRALDLPGLESDRAAVFPAGVAILSAAFQFLGIETMDTTSGALREGLVQELLGGVAQGDPRDQAVTTLAVRHKVDGGQAERVEATALALFRSANASWGHDAGEGEQLLSWAARLHETGLSIAYSGHHRHSAYIVEHSDLPGFSIDEQQLVATLIGGHRRKITKKHFERVPKGRRSLALHLTVLLRLAVRLHHSRSAEPLPEIVLSAKKSRLALTFPEGWLVARPLTRADLLDEVRRLERVGVTLVPG